MHLYGDTILVFRLMFTIGEHAKPRWASKVRSLSMIGVISISVVDGLWPCRKWSYAFVSREVTRCTSLTPSFPGPWQASSCVVMDCPGHLNNSERGSPAGCSSGMNRFFLVTGHDFCIVSHGAVVETPKLICICSKKKNTDSETGGSCVCVYGYGWRILMWLLLPLIYNKDE